MRRILLIGLDLVLVATGTVFAILLRDNLDVDAERVGPMALYTFTTMASGAAVLGIAGVSRTSWRHLTARDYRFLATLTAIIVVVALSMGFAANRLEGVARAVPLLQMVLMPLLMIGARVAYKSHHLWRRSASALSAVGAPIRPAETVLLVGETALAELYVNCARRFADGEIFVAGLIARSVAPDRGRLIYGLPVHGAIDDIPHVIRQLAVHGVVVTRLIVAHDANELSHSETAGIERAALQQVLRVDYLADLLGFSASTDVARRACEPPPSAVASATLLVAEIASRRPYWACKRGIDIAMAAALLILMAPVMLVTALGVAVSLGLPLLFWQYRPGRGGRAFRLYKFRSMRDVIATDGQPVPDDLRLTRFGRFIRATHLDELPQLVNVLKGEMSFVGPRPLIAAEQTTIPSARLLVRPGLTGWAQIKGGRALSIADKAALDLWYIRNASVLLDVRIVLATVRLMIHGDRADQRAISRAWSDVTPLRNVQ